MYALDVLGHAQMHAKDLAEEIAQQDVVLHVPVFVLVHVQLYAEHLLVKFFLKD